MNLLLLEDNHPFNVEGVWSPTYITPVVISLFGFSSSLLNLRKEPNCPQCLCLVPPVKTSTESMQRKGRREVPSFHDVITIDSSHSVSASSGGSISTCSKQTQPVMENTKSASKIIPLMDFEDANLGALFSRMALWCLPLHLLRFPGRPNDEFSGWKMTSTPSTFQHDFTYVAVSCPGRLFTWVHRQRWFQDDITPRKDFNTKQCLNANANHQFWNLRKSKDIQKVKSLYRIKSILALYI